MLANRYLKTFHFADALPYLERAHRERPNDLGTAKKLVLCYTQTGRTSDAIALMTSLMERGADAVVRPDPMDDLPMRHALAVTRRRERALPEGIYHALLGILLLYTDERSALGELKRAIETGAGPGGLDRLQRAVERHVQVA